MKNIAIILAGGVGSRVGANIPKQFIKVLGRPVIDYTLEVFEKNEEIDLIEVVCVKGYEGYLNNIVTERGYKKIKKIVTGGKDFQHSVLNGLRGLKDLASQNDNLIIHFGASPFITNDIISDSIRVCNEKGNAISTMPFYLLCGTNDGEKSLKYIDRNTIACMSSPHTFKYSLIEDMYRKAEEEDILDKIEPHTTTLMYELGIPIFFSKGNQTNIKITTSEDLRLFEGYLLTKSRKQYQKGPII